MKKATIIITFITCLLHFSSFAQTIPVGSPVLDDYYRREQLLGHLDSTFSFSVGPTVSAKAIGNANIFVPDSVENKFNALGPQVFGNGKGLFQLLPLTWQQQINTDHPYGWNDGVMIPAKGYQTMISAGFFVKYGILSIQFRPEYVYAANPQFAGFAGGHINQQIGYYYDYHNFIDAPEYFGTGSYSKAFLGQSSIRLTVGSVSLGLSNENLWWGPGIYNALILTNNAPGFAHITFNSVKPVNIGIGQIEWQLIAGKLIGSGYSPLPETLLSDGTDPYIPKRNDWRYFTGLNINYHPKWIPGFTIGLIRTFDAYEADVKGFSGYFPFFTPYSKDATISANGQIGDPFARDQYTSLYARWLFPKAQAEFYFEYGLNDNSYNLTDFIQTPEHSRAYIVGLRKILPFAGKKDEHIVVSGEIDQLSQSSDRIVRNSGGWYTHEPITDGHTNLGQVLGAGTGSGGNLQTAEISWVSGLKKLGILFQRYEHDVDYYESFIGDIDGNSGNWVDLALGITGEYNYKNFLFNAKIQEIKSLNYEWILKGYTPGMTYYIPNNTVYNLHAELGITYRF